MMQRRMTLKSASMAIAMILAAYSVTSSAQAQEAPVKPSPATITVTGMGNAQVKPDLARIIVSISTEAASAPDASGLNRETSEKVIAKIRSFAIPAEDLKTLDMQLFRISSYSKSSLVSASSKGFRAEHQLEITLRDTASVGKIVGNLLSIDDMTLQSINWDVAQQQPANDQARTNAVLDARHRAEIYAKAAGVQLGRLMTIRDEARFNEPVAFRAMAVESAHGSGGAMPLIAPAAITFSANAQMVWELVP